MTISATPRRASYTGDGSTVTFAVPFKFLADSHLKVVVTTSGGIETLVTPSHISGAGAENGGSVTLSSAPVTGDTITVLGATPLEQQTDLAVSDGMPADVIEAAVDLLTIQNQEQDVQIGRAIKLPIAYSGDELQFPAPVPNEVPYYDENGKLVMSSVGFSTLMSTVHDLINLANDTGQAHTHDFSVLTGTDQVLLLDVSKILTKGFPITPVSYGNLSGNPTIDFSKPRGCTMINNGNGAIGNPSGYGEQVVIITNSGSPGTPDISAMNLVNGVFSETPSTGKTRMYIERYESSPANVWLEVLA